MGEKEVYSTFYGGLNVDSKDDLNIAAQGDFSQTPFTQAKNILEKLIEAKRSYESSRGRYGRRSAVHAVETHNDEKLEARFEQMEKKLLEAVEKAKAPPIAKAEEKRHMPAPPPQEHHYYYCEFPPEVDPPAQVNAVGHWNQNGNWIQGKQRDAPWRDHPNFRWSDQNQGPLTQSSTQQTQLFEGQPSWSTHIQERPLNGGNGWSSNAQGNWPKEQHGNWTSGGQTNWSNRQQDRNWGYQYQGPQSSNQGRQPSNRVPNYAPPYQRGNQQDPYSSFGHQQLGHGGDQSTQRYNRPQIEGPGDMMAPPPDALREMQETQKEQRAALEMLTKQLSQVAMSLGELRGNEGKIPATVQQPAGREIVNTVSLKSETVCQTSSASSPVSRLAHDVDFNSSALNQVIKAAEADTSEPIAKKGRMVEVEKTTGEIRSEDLPPKKTDPGVFTLPIAIRSVLTEQAMCDLGASINIMPHSMYKKLGEPKLAETDMEIQLADGSCIYPEGVLENEIVKVNKFMYLADFFVIKMAEPEAEESIGILLGRPFLSTAGTIIDVRNGTMKLEFNGERLTVDINKTTRKPRDKENIQSMNVVRPLDEKKLEKRLLAESSSESTKYEKLKRKAADWCEATVTERMDDQSIEKAIMEFCELPQPADSSIAARPARVEGQFDQNVPLRNVPKKDPPLSKEPTPTGQLTLSPTLQATVKNPPTQVHQAPCKLNIQGRKNQLLEKMVSNQIVMGKEVSEQKEIDPGPCLRSTVSKGMTPTLDPQNKRRELTVGQEELLSQHRLNLMSRKRKSKWEDSNTSIVIRTEGSVERQNNSDSPSLLVNGREAEPYRDKTKAGIVEEIPLTSPDLSQ